MKRKILSLMLAGLMLSCVCRAQDVSDADTIATAQQSSVLNLQSLIAIGYLSYEAVLRQMPQYDSVQVQVDELREAYEKELKRVEDEFNQKYEEFLEGRAEYPRTILLKRQQELQDMMQRNITFKNQSRRELHRAEQEAMAPLRIRLNEAIATVARQLGIVLVVNTDADACPFIEPTVSQNIEEMVKQIISEQ